jgi:Fe-S-cluster containining protein
MGKPWEGVMAVSNTGSSNRWENPLQLNRKIAYRGEVGRRREEYCVEQLRYMRACYKKIGEDQLEHVRAAGKTISCSKGCDACCRNLFVGATLQECEAIAYFLQQNEELLARFIANYPAWRASVRDKGDQFMECERRFADILALGPGKAREEAFDESIKLHNRQNICCPFLEDNLCAIYECRPANCAGFFVTSHPALCEPGKVGEHDIHPEYTLTHIEDVVNDTSFYYKSLECPVTLYTPVAVYRILEEGYAYLNQFAGLRGIKQEAFNDPDVRAILHNRPGR